MPTAKTRIVEGEGTWGIVNKVQISGPLKKGGEPKIGLLVRKGGKLPEEVSVRRGGDGRIRVTALMHTTLSPEEE